MKTKITLILASILLTSCATIPQPRPTLQDKQSIKSTHVMLNTNQTRISMRHNNPFNSDMYDPYSPRDTGAIVHSNPGFMPPNLVGLLMVEGIKSAQEHSAKKSM